MLNLHSTHAIGIFSVCLCVCVEKDVRTGLVEQCLNRSADDAYSLLFYYTGISTHLFVKL